MNRPLIQYYAATLLFLLLDFAVDINLRIAFLEQNLTARIAYYGLCALCFGLMVWRPRLAPAIAAFESLLALVALILTTATRTLLATDTMIETGRGFLTVEEIVNFLIVGFISYFIWMRGMREMLRKNG